MLKQEEVENDDSCLNQAEDNEFIFVLRGKDISSPLVVLEWIKLNFETAPKDKLKEAFNCALNMLETVRRKTAD